MSNKDINEMSLSEVAKSDDDECFNLGRTCERMSILTWLVNKDRKYEPGNAIHDAFKAVKEGKL